MFGAKFKYRTESMSDAPKYTAVQHRGPDSRTERNQATRSPAADSATARPGLESGNSTGDDNGTKLVDS